ncbi:protein FAM216B isoform B [Alligator mississippiensis]|uniref:Protein FAM216B isoform B n=2 Tax=Alligator mississippiensis TaxID=8496 RepID=A0A151MHM3_ALLMI|nr:protein FAM216B isoform B [Alligator mississippiensis]
MFSSVEKQGCISGGTLLLRLRSRMGENRKRNPGHHHSPKVLGIQVPPSAQNTYLLKDLKWGQKCYLYSIMRVYDNKPMRKTLYHQYMLNLQRQNLLGRITQQEARSYVSFLEPAEEMPLRKVSDQNSASVMSSVKMR